MRTLYLDVEGHPTSRSIDEGPEVELGNVTCLLEDMTRRTAGPSTLEVSLVPVTVLLKVRCTSPDPRRSPGSTTKLPWTKPRPSPREIRNLYFVS